MRDEHLQLLATKLILELPAIKYPEKLPNLYFVGKAGVGKSYNAKFVIEKYGYQVAKFAYPVYMIAEKYFNMKNKDRKLLQVIGTDAGRDQINSEIWVKRFEEDMKIVKMTTKILNKSIPKFVMDDCRFPNEHQILKEFGFVGIYIDVPDKIRYSRLAVRDGTVQENTLNHKSEILIDSFKDELIKLDGSGTLEQSYKKLNELLRSLTQRKKSVR